MTMSNKIKLNMVSLLKKLAHVIPKKKNLWVFGAWSGKNYSDNTKYLFEHITSAHKDINCGWLTKNDGVGTILRSKGLKAYKMNSLRGIYAAMRAQVAFETAGDFDISFALDRRSTIVVQLWHGMGYKALKWKDDAGNLLFSEDTKNRLNSYYWMSTSELYSKVRHKLMGIDSDRFFITGYPRNDTFVTKPHNNAVDSLLQQFKEYKKIIYMPTHRNFGKSNDVIVDTEELHKVDRILEENKTIMVFKPHFYEMHKLEESNEQFTNIILASDPKIWSDAYTYIHDFDLLISDYSSIITDYLCSGNPIILFDFDLEKYQEEEGLLDIYFEYQCGPVVRSWSECIKQAISMLENDTWKENRDSLRKTYHQFNDGKNSERVYQTVKDIIAKKQG